MLPGAAVPERVGVVSLVLAPGAMAPVPGAVSSVAPVIAGTGGADVSIVIR